MPRIQPLLSVLRPLAAPRRATCQQLFCFSTATRLRVERPSTPASTPPPPPSSKPSKSPKISPDAPSTPQEASRAADLAATEAATDADSAQPPAVKPTLPSKRPKASKPKRSESADNAEPSTSAPIASPDTTEGIKTRRAKALKAKSKAKRTFKTRTPNPPTIQLPPPKYHVARSMSKNLPIYMDYKRGGNLHLTTIRKITGDLSALRHELRVFLNKKNEEIKINSLTQHVIVKGHHVPEVTEFLKARGM